jgi:hypothetical protein
MANNLCLFDTIGVMASRASKYVENSGTLMHSCTCNDALVVRIHVANTNNGLRHRATLAPTYASYIPLLIDRCQITHRAAPTLRLLHIRRQANKSQITPSLSQSNWRTVQNP